MTTNKEYLIGRFVKARQVGIDLVNLDSSCLAGYYLVNFPNDPIGALMIDIRNLAVASTTGMSAKLLIVSVLAS